MATTIIQALAAVADDVRSVRKTDKNTHQNFNFRGIDAVLNAVGPAFRTHGVVCMPITESVDLDTVMTTGGKASTRAMVKVTYRFYGPQGDHVDAVVTGESWDMGDKATAKAYSVAYRTALLQTLTIPTDEPDPDHSTFEQTVPEIIDAATRQELVSRITELNAEELLAYNEWRKDNKVPSVKSGPVTPKQAAMVYKALEGIAGGSS